MEYVAAVPAAGVPLSVPVPFPLSVKVTPLGSAPVSIRDGFGMPVVVTINVPRVPTVNVVLVALVMAGAWSTVSVKLCIVLPELLVALKVIGYVPPVPAPGVPLRTPVAGVNVTPVGNVPVSLNVGLGVPVAVTVNVPGVPTVKVVLFALVITGAVFTVSVKGWLAGVPTPLLAVNVMGYIAAVPDAGVPLSVPVPSLLSTNVTPLGSAPVSIKDGTGKPVVITVNDAETPTVNMVLFALMMAGA